MDLIPGLLFDEEAKTRPTVQPFTRRVSSASERGEEGRHDRSMLQTRLHYTRGDFSRSEASTFKTTRVISSS